MWDWNGTLLDDCDHCVAVVNGMLRDRGLQELDAARYREVFDFPVRRYYERLGFDLDGAGWAALAARFISDYDRGVMGCSLHGGAAEALRALKQRGIPSSILSAARRTSVEAQLERLGIRDLFGDVVGLQDDYAHGKVELGVDWLQASGLPPEQVLLVGDTAHDFEVAKAMGVGCVLIASGHHARDRLEACGVAVLGALRDLLD